VREKHILNLIHRVTNHIYIILLVT